MTQPSGDQQAYPPPYEPPHRGPRRRRARTAVVLGAAGVLGVVAIGGGAAAYQAYYATGDQPSQALPADTLAYLSVDLDPSGRQKLEALEVLERFPGFGEFSDEVGLDRDDVRRTLFDQIVDATPCADLDFDDDIDPWLGGRFAAAVVPDDTSPNVPELGGDVVFVAEVSDAAAASDGMERIADCGGEDEVGWAAEGSWLVVSDTSDAAERVLDGAAEASLADDAAYGRWTDAAGGAGILNVFVGSGAADQLVEALDGDLDDAIGDELGLAIGEADREAVRTAAEDFEGAALAARFADGGLEVVGATQARLGAEDGERPALTAGTAGDLAASLPDTTGAALAVGLVPYWYEALLANLVDGGLASEDVEAGVAAVEDETGLRLPDDLRTLLGEGVALAVDGERADLDTLEGSEGPQDLPLAAKVLGTDADEVRDVLDDLLEASGAPDEVDVAVEGGDGGSVALGFDDDVVADVAEEGGLGGTDVFEDVVPETDDVHALLFLDLRAGDGWLEDLARDLGDDELADNVAPLSAVGLSVRVDDDVARTVLRITTDD
ncbi:DUF3352 domain-containing protein [Nocardioides sp. ChNu-153]|uniref:DUF3352 domain-containing protein n=1 Tax=Nocardioides sp. ChNu-153 TaxID=2779364 RepID=UPI002652947A|nr:DUF3352 domain-containing protein [Nocardioides sp. ChNu-153]MDN7120912.1 DUF3352 domain-containing protein [Nocardioides sp. ChNu-153]